MTDLRNIRQHDSRTKASSFFVITSYTGSRISSVHSLAHFSGSRVQLSQH